MTALLLLIALQDPDAIRVEKFVVNGATALSEAEIRAIVAPHEGTDMTMEQIGFVATRIEIEYFARGMIFTVAFVPEQEIRDGVVEITVVEGRITRIDVTPPPSHYDEEFLRNYAQPLLDNPRPTQADLDRALLNLSALPGMNAYGTLKPGDAAGDSILTMNLEEQHPFWAALHYDNYGTRDISEHRLSATLGLANLWDLGHWITVTNIVGFPVEHLWVIRPEYHAPIGADGLILHGAYTRTDFESDGALAVLDPTGRGQMIDVWATYPIIQETDLKLGLDAGFEWKELEQQFLGVTASEDRLSILRAGLNFEYMDGFGRNFAGIGVRQGFSNFLGSNDAVDEDASRLGAGGEFTSFTFYYARYQPVTEWLALVPRFSAQYAGSSDPLPAVETFGIGGFDSVRGYPSFEFSGDRGFNWGIEAQFKPVFLGDVPDPFDENSGRSLADMFQWVLFYEHGQAEVTNPAAGQDDLEVLNGWGTGIRVGYPGWIGIRYDVAWPVSGPTPSTRERPTHYVGVDVTINF